MRLILLVLALALAGCGANYGADNPMWGNMTGTGLRMMQGPPHVDCYSSGYAMRCW
jgi:hypothetical protein